MDRAIIYCKIKSEKSKSEATEHLKSKGLVMDETLKQKSKLDIKNNLKIIPITVKLL